MAKNQSVLRALFPLFAGLAILASLGGYIWFEATRPLNQVIQTANSTTILWGTVVEPKKYTVGDDVEYVFSNKTGHVRFDQDGKAWIETRNGFVQTSTFPSAAEDLRQEGRRRLKIFELVEKSKRMAAPRAAS